MSDSKAEFEALMVADGFMVDRRYDGEYASVHVFGAWRGWQAGRASMQAEVVKKCDQVIITAYLAVEAIGAKTCKDAIKELKP